MNKCSMKSMIRVIISILAAVCVVELILIVMLFGNIYSPSDDLTDEEFRLLVQCVDRERDAGTVGDCVKYVIYDWSVVKGKVR